jgi:hypothetical protein
MQNDVPNSDRFLIVSVTTYARCFTQKHPVEKTMRLWEEALQVLQKRFDSGDVVPEDFWVLKRVVKDYLDFLRENDLPGDASRILEDTTALLEAVQTFPPPSLWLEACMVLEPHAVDGQTFEAVGDLCKRHRKLLKRHPEFKTDKNLKRYDRALKLRLDELKKALLEQTKSEPQSENHGS